MELRNKQDNNRIGFKKETDIAFTFSKTVVDRKARSHKRIPQVGTVRN